MRCAGGIALAALVAISITPYPVHADESAPSGQIVNDAEKPDQKTLDRLAALVEKNPNDVSARCALGACYDKLGLPDLAREQFSLAVKAAPNDPHLWMNRVRQELKSGHSELGMHLIESAHERFPTDPEVLFWYGNYFAAKQRIDDAAYAYQLALNKDKEVEGLRSALGEVCLEKLRYGDALKLADEEIKRHPNFWLAYKVKAFALMGLRKQAQAVAPLRVAFANYPTKAIVARTYAHACIWCGKYEEGLEPALTFLNSSTGLTTADSGAKMMLSTIISNLPQSTVERELPALNEKIQARMPNPAYYFALGDILDRASMNELAISQYLSGLKMEPNFARALFRLGRDYEISRRDYQTALLLYKSANQLSPNDPEIEAHLRRLYLRYKSRYNDLAWQLKDWLRPSIPSAIENHAN